MCYRAMILQAIAWRLSAVDSDIMIAQIIVSCKDSGGLVQSIRCGNSDMAHHITHKALMVTPTKVLS